MPLPAFNAHISSQDQTHSLRHRPALTKDCEPQPRAGCSTPSVLCARVRRPGKADRRRQTHGVDARDAGAPASTLIKPVSTGSEGKSRMYWDTGAPAPTPQPGAAPAPGIKPGAVRPRRPASQGPRLWTLWMPPD
ncbi:hypothetical protein HJG60_009222 [Phyllostomus discolor]|uniref:Uncharacterized protein n=1 Tax=Phyllostomus discolor TaxID=89673 RepID=A0A833YFQ6_9CHIR|nr:hypothetical protein HJG60_009222 [Phyllostomus discolor]